jgi:hypothetical protein
MAKIYISQLQKKYKFKEGEVTGLNYRRLMQDILANQSDNMAKIVNRISNSNYKKQISKVKDIEKKLILPDLSDVMPKRSVFIKKGAIDGDIISDTLRDSLTKNLRQSLDDFKTKTGLPAYVRLRGKKAGTINPKVVKEFEKSIKQTFDKYTKIDPKYGMPANIHTIAVTEIRSTINPIKYKYNMKLYQKNKDKFNFFKMWRQNKSLSVEYRRGHNLVNGKKILIDQFFEVPRIIKKAGKWVQVAIDKMKHPHDFNAVAEQNIGCNCDLVIFAVPKKS